MVSTSVTVSAQESVSGTVSVNDIVAVLPEGQVTPIIASDRVIAVVTEDRVVSCPATPYGPACSSRSSG